MGSGIPLNYLRPLRERSEAQETSRHMSNYGNNILQSAIDDLHASGHGGSWLTENKNTPWCSSAQALTSESRIQDFSIGTGRTLFASSLLPAVLAAEHEIILATCFWAPGPTLDQLSSTLRQLSQKVITQGRESKVKVYICLSSRSLIQKLFHTSSANGYIYPPRLWNKELGLPHPSDLPGLDICVKSLFFRPFSVLHSKYLIIDRHDLWMPSCNVSWEEWYECCVHVRGDAVSQVLQFWRSIWDMDGRSAYSIPTQASTLAMASYSTAGQPGLHPLKQMIFKDIATSTTILPHAHHDSIKLNLWFLSGANIQPPSTPLNTMLLHLMSQARRFITLLTPNLTSRPVYHAILEALSGGVNVRLITNRRMMVLEQLVTSGTISEFWLWRLRRVHRVLAAKNSTVQVGRLRLECFSPSQRIATSEGWLPDDLESGSGLSSATTKTHIKLTIVDGDIIVLGSGNMDRASWYTSQELGIMLEGKDVVTKIWDQVERGLDNCLETYYSERHQFKREAAVHLKSCSTEDLTAIAYYWVTVFDCIKDDWNVSAGQQQPYEKLLGLLDLPQRKCERYASLQLKQHVKEGVLTSLQSWSEVVGLHLEQRRP